MTQLRTMLLAAAAVGTFAGTAAAAPLATVEPGSSLVQNIRMVCDQFGRCYEARRHVYSDYDDGYYPRGRAYGYYGSRPRTYYDDEGPGVGFSFGFGDRWR